MQSSRSSFPQRHAVRAWKELLEGLADEDQRADDAQVARRGGQILPGHGAQNHRRLEGIRRSHSPSKRHWSRHHVPQSLHVARIPVPVRYLNSVVIPSRSSKVTVFFELETGVSHDVSKRVRLDEVEELEPRTLAEPARERGDARSDSFAIGPLL